MILSQGPQVIYEYDDSQKVGVFPGIDPTRMGGFGNNVAEAVQSPWMWVPVGISALLILSAIYLAYKSSTLSGDGLLRSLMESRVIAAVGLFPLIIWLIIVGSGALTSDKFSDEEMSRIKESAIETLGPGTEVIQREIESTEIIQFFEQRADRGEKPVLCHADKRDFRRSDHMMVLRCITDRLDITPGVWWITFPNLDEAKISRKAPVHFGN